MAQRDLGTAVLNIKIVFQKLNQKDIKEKLARTLENLEKVFEKSAATALKNANKTSKTIELAEKIGKDIVGGLITGIKSKKQDAEAAITQINTAILNKTKKDFKTQSPSKVFHQIGIDVVQGFINGVRGNTQQANDIMHNLASGAKSAFSDEISNLERDLKGVFKKIARLIEREKKAAASGKSLSPRQQAQLAEFEAQARNIQESIRVAQARAARDPNFRIEDVGKRRASEVERSNAKLEKQSTAIRKVAGALAELERTFIKSDGKIKSFSTAVDASGEKFTKYLTAIVKANKETMTSQELAALLAKEKAKLAAAIQSSVKNTQLAAAMTNRLNQAEQKAGELVDKVAQKNKDNLAKQAGGIITLIAKQKQLWKTYESSDRSAEAFNSTLEANRTLYDKLLGGIVKKNAKMKDEKKILEEIELAYESLRQEIIKTTKAGLTRDSLLDQLGQARGKADGRAVGVGVGDRLRNISDGILTADKAGLRKAQSELAALRRESRLTKEDLQKIDKVAARVALQIKRIDQTNLANIRKGIHSLTSGVNQFGEQLRRVSFILRDVGRQMMMMSRRGFGFVKPSIDDFMKFEQSITDVLAITGELNNGLTKTDVVASDLGQTILGLAGKFSFSADQIAETAKQLALAGFTAEQISVSLESVIQLAAATGSELSTAANIVVSSMATFGLEAEHANRVADVFAAAVTRANTNLNQLGEAFKIVAPVAAASGQSIEQVAAALGVLANSGLRGTLAGTGLARVLTQLTEKAGKLDAILKPLGSSFDEIDPEKRNLSEIVEVFDRLNLSTATLLSIFEQRAFRSLNAILAQGSDRLGSMVDQLERANRVAQAISSARLNTLATNVQLLSDAMTSLRITLGQLVGEQLNSVVNFLKELVVGLRDLIELNKKEVAVVVRGLIAFLGVLSAVGTALFTLGSGAAFAAAPLIAIGAALAAFNALVASATALVPLFASFGSAFLFVAGAAGAFSAVIFSTFGAIIALFASLTASIAVAPEAWGNFFADLTAKVQDFFNNVLIPIYNGFVSRTEQIKQSTETLLNALGELFDPAMFNGGLWEGFGSLLALIVETMLEFTAVVIKDLTPAIQDLAANLAKFSSFMFVASIGFDKNKKSLISFAEIINKFPFSDLLLLQTPLGSVSWMLTSYFAPDTKKRENKDDPERAKKVEELTKKFNEQRNAIAQVSSAASNYATELSKVSSIFNDLGGAKAVEFSKLSQTDLSQATRQKNLQEIKAQLAFLNEFKKSAKGVMSLAETNQRIKELEEAKKVIEQVGKQIDSVNELIAGKSAVEIQKSISEGIAAESEKIKNLNSLTDQITDMQNMLDFGGTIAPDQIEKVRAELSKVLGVAIELDEKNPIQSLVAALRSSIPDAQKASQAQIKIYQDLLKILPELEGLDITTKEGAERFAQAFADLAENQEKLKELIELDEARLDLEKEFAKAGRNSHQQRMADLQEEIDKREQLIEKMIEVKQAQIDSIKTDIRVAVGEGRDTTSLDNQLKTAEGDLDAIFDLQNRNRQEGVKKSEEAIDELRKAREEANTKIMEMQLEVEEDVQRRIELRQRLARDKRERQLEQDLAALKDKMDPVANKAELEELENQMRDAARAVGQAEDEKIVKEETKDKDKDMNKVVDKRLDLETDLLSTLGKQVTTLQQMAALMQFIEALQRRKDRRALEDIGKLAKAREKLARIDKMIGLGGEKGERAMLAKQQALDEFALLGGIAERGAAMAGAPKVVLNPNAMVNELIISLRDLTDAIKGFRIGNMAAGIIPAGLNTDGPALAANFGGGTVNNVDNSVKNINIRTNNPDLAKRMANV